MDKREFEISKLEIKAKRFEAYLGIIRLLLVCGTITLAIHSILIGIKPMIGQSASQINAFASLVQSFHLGSIFGYVLAGILGIAWIVERKGKHRAIQQKAHFQNIAEKMNQTAPAVV
jgi:hypothetical protein